MALNAHESLGYFLQHLVGSKGSSKHTVAAYRRDLHQFFASILGEEEFDPETHLEEVDILDITPLKILHSFPTRRSSDIGRASCRERV